MHDPFIKRVVVVAINDMLTYVEKEGIEIGFKDLGAGGISCATSELAVAGGMGCELNLNQVPVVDPKLDPEIIACSETQERFCVVVPESHAEAICDIFNKQHDMGSLYPGAGAAVIGTVIDEPKYRIRYNNELICDLPVSTITTEVLADRVAIERTIQRGTDAVPQGLDLNTVATTMLARLNNAQKKYIYRNYDQFVKNNGVVIPGEADARVLAPIKGADNGVAITIDSNTYGTVDPYVAGAYAVAESIRNVIAVGAEPIALTDCLNYGNPEKGDVFFDFQEGVRGIGDAARQLSTHDDVVPIISGNVSFYNESTTGQAVVPSPVICCIGRMPNANNAHRMQLVNPGSTLYVLGQRHAHFAQTELAKTLADLSIEFNPTTTPQVDFKHEKAINKALYQALNANDQNGLAGAVHDISQGGVWQALVEMVGGDRNWPLVGLDITLPADQDPVTFLFSESGGYIVEVASEHTNAFETLVAEHGVTAVNIGQTNVGDSITINHNNTAIIQQSVTNCLTAWNQKIKPLQAPQFTTKAFRRKP